MYDFETMQNHWCIKWKLNGKQKKEISHEHYSYCSELDIIFLRSQRNLMEVKGAFNHISKPCLLAELGNINIDGDLTRWTASFLEDRWITMMINGHDTEAHSVQTGASKVCKFPQSYL